MYNLVIIPYMNPDTYEYLRNETLKGSDIEY
jgi:hypothetical protein